MSGYVDLENEDLIEADENDLYNTIDDIVEEDPRSENELNSDSEQPTNENAPADDSQPTATRVAPKKKVVRNPQPKLDADRLKGPRGLGIIEEWFSEVKLKGKGHEKEDLDAVMSRLEQWTNRLFPKFTFDDCIKRIETLGSKKPVMDYVSRMRLNMEAGHGGHVTVEDIDEPEVRETDPFDSLLEGEPQIISSQAPSLTDEQRERILRNRLLAEEKRLARAKQRAEEQARQQKEAEEIAEALAASQVLDNDFLPEDMSQQNSSSNVNFSATNDSDELMHTE